MLISAFGAFGAWCTDPDGKFGIILTLLFMFIPGVNLIPALVYLVLAGLLMGNPAQVFKKCTKFWKFLFGENSIY